jgi:hypothetical protein
VADFSTPTRRTYIERDFTDLLAAAVTRISMEGTPIPLL